MRTTPPHRALRGDSSLSPPPRWGIHSQNHYLNAQGGYFRCRGPPYIHITRPLFRRQNLVAARSDQLRADLPFVRGRRFVQRHVRPPRRYSDRPRNPYINDPDIRRAYRRGCRLSHTRQHHTIRRERPQLLGERLPPPRAQFNRVLYDHSAQLLGITGNEGARIYTHKSWEELTRFEEGGEVVSLAYGERGREIWGVSGRDVRSLSCPLSWLQPGS